MNTEPSPLRGLLEATRDPHRWTFADGGRRVIVGPPQGQWTPEELTAVRELVTAGWWRADDDEHGRAVFRLED